MSLFHYFEHTLQWGFSEMTLVIIAPTIECIYMTCERRDTQTGSHRRGRGVGRGFRECGRRIVHPQSHRTSHRMPLPRCRHHRNLLVP